MSMTAPFPAQRVLAAAPHEVFRAWLEPALVGRWMAPGVEVTRVAIDPRIGGHYRVWYGAEGSDAGGFDGEILELVADARLVLLWGFVGPRRREGPVFDSRLTITVAATPDGGTLLGLVHERLDDLAATMPQVAKNVAAGWEMVLDKLAHVVA